MKRKLTRPDGIGRKLLRLLIAVSVVGVLFGGMAGTTVADTTGDNSETEVGSTDCFEIGNPTVGSSETGVSQLSGKTATIFGVDPSTVPLQTGNSTTFCDVKYISNLMDAAFTVFIGGALVLGLLTWVVTSFAEALPLPSDLKTTLKQQRNSAVASMFRAVFVPAIVITLLDATNLVIPQCITVLPF